MFKESFIASYLAFWLKSSIAIDNNFVRLSNPNTILKLIPLGEDNKSVPVNQLATVEDNFKLDFGTLVWGIICTVISFNVLGEMFLLGVILFLYGVATILSSFQVKLDLITTSGMTYSLEVVIFEKTRLMSIKPLIENMIGNRLDYTNVAVNTDRMIGAMYHFNTMNNAQVQNNYNQIPGQNYSQIPGASVNNLQESSAAYNLENNVNYAQQTQPIIQNSGNSVGGQQVQPMKSPVNPFGDQPVQSQRSNVASDSSVRQEGKIQPESVFQVDSINKNVTIAEQKNQGLIEPNPQHTRGSLRKKKLSRGR